MRRLRYGKYTGTLVQESVQMNRSDASSSREPVRAGSFRILDNEAQAHFDCRWGRAPVRRSSWASPVARRS